MMHVMLGADGEFTFMATHYFDTYAFIETINSNPNYRAFANEEIVTSKLTLVELYGYLLREQGKEKADFYFDKILVNCADIPDQVLKLGVLLRSKVNSELKRKKKPLSYIDAITYVLANHLGLKFITGDETFKGLPNVEFVK